MFEVGDVVIYVRYGSIYNGEEAVVTSGLFTSEWSLNGVIGGPSALHWIRFSDGKEYGAEPHELRKKRPPEEYDGNTLVSWNDIPYYRPRKLVRA